MTLYNHLDAKKTTKLELSFHSNFQILLFFFFFTEKEKLKNLNHFIHPDTKQPLHTPLKTVSLLNLFHLSGTCFLKEK